METVKAIIAGAPEVLVDGGTLQMVIRSKIGVKTLPETFMNSFGNVKIVARGSGFRVLLGERIVGS